MLNSLAAVTYSSGELPYVFASLEDSFPLIAADNVDSFAIAADDEDEDNHHHRQRRKNGSESRGAQKSRTSS